MEIVSQNRILYSVKQELMGQAGPGLMITYYKENYK